MVAFICICPLNILVLVLSKYNKENQILLCSILVWLTISQSMLPLSIFSYFSSIRCYCWWYLYSVESNELTIAQTGWLEPKFIYNCVCVCVFFVYTSSMPILSRLLGYLKKKFVVVLLWGYMIQQHNWWECHPCT